MSLLDTLVPKVRKHRVAMPENLCTISQKYYGCPDYAMAIFQANRSVLTDPNQVSAGQVLVIPHLPHVRRNG